MYFNDEAVSPFFNIIVANFFLDIAPEILAPFLTDVFLEISLLLF